MKQMMSNLIDRYLYPDQIVFGHLFNPNIKSAHNYEMSKSTPMEQQNDQLIIFQKQMSQIKIKSMLNMMQGKHEPLFKSSLSTSKQKNAYNYKNQPESNSEDYEDDEDESYDQQMYLMEKQYQDYFQDQYDQQQNPIMTFGQSLGGLPTIKNYAKQFNYNPNLKVDQKYSANPKIFKPLKVRDNFQNKQIGLGRSLGLKDPSIQQLLDLKNTDKKLGIKINANKKQLERKDKKKNQHQKQSDQDWQTQSQEQVDGK